MLESEYIQDLFKCLDAIQPLSEGCKKYLNNVLKSHHLKKRQHLIKPELQGAYVFYVKKGMLRTYYRNVDGKEINIRFIKEGVTIIATFLGKYADHVFIQAIEPTKILYITHEEERYLFNHFPEYNFIARKLLEHFLREAVLPKIYMCNLPAASQRYSFLLQWQPDLASSVSSKHLSSLLGMSEYTLSRLRGNS